MLTLIAKLLQIRPQDRGSKFATNRAAAFPGLSKKTVDYIVRTTTDKIRPRWFRGGRPSSKSARNSGVDDKVVHRFSCSPQSCITPRVFARRAGARTPSIRPSGSGVRQLTVQRIVRLICLVGGSSGHAAPWLTGPRRHQAERPPRCGGYDAHSPTMAVGRPRDGPSGANSKRRSGGREAYRT